MLKTIDRIQIATDDANRTADRWTAMLGAEPDSEDSVEALGARRLRSRLGRGFIEFLEPAGGGAISDALDQRKRPHLFAGGISTTDLELTVGQLRNAGIDVAREADQAFVDLAPVLGIPSRLVISKFEERTPVGAIDFLYEVTLLTRNAPEISSKFASLFGLDEQNFVPIASERFGYSGVLTLFHPDGLHRFEIIDPYDETTTMGRFHTKTGPAYYMCFAETLQMNRIEKQAETLGTGITVDRPEDRDPSQSADQMWLHPPGLDGVMLGLSRPSMAWQWSGHPERVEALQ